jgi:hypothetical protein
MKFVLVNDRTLNPQTCCAQCCDPIRESYLRELAISLSYCSHDCYLGDTKIALPAIQYQARAS